jgi:hypothetical protein
LVGDYTRDRLEQQTKGKAAMSAQREDLSDAEAQLIWIIRTSKNFTVTIHADSGRWDVKLEDHDSGGCGSGTGQNFPSAWDDVIDPRLRAAKW